MADIIDEYIEHVRNYYEALHAAQMILMEFPSGAHRADALLGAANKYASALVDYAEEENEKAIELAKIIREREKEAMT